MSTLVPLSKQFYSYRRLWALMCLTLFIAGCSFAPIYKRPGLPVPASQSSDALNLKMGEGIPELLQDERRLIKDLSPNGELHGLVSLALSHNRDFRLICLRVKEARAGYGVARADRLPTLGLGVERDRQHFNNAASEERYGQDITLATLGVSDFDPDFFRPITQLVRGCSA
ncbi:hypothetical protein LRS56_06100 [Pseudomonas poae]|nr:hypothetical protein LRS56_06100 [Pseudomonas poae]